MKIWDSDNSFALRESVRTVPKKSTGTVLSDFPVDSQLFPKESVHGAMPHFLWALYLFISHLFIDVDRGLKIVMCLQL